MDTAQDGEGGDGTEQEEVDARSVYVGNVSIRFEENQRHISNPYR